MRKTHRPHRRLAARALTALAMTAACSAALAPAVAATSRTLRHRTPLTKALSHDVRLPRRDFAVVTGSASDPDDVDGRLDIQRVRDRVFQLDGSHYLISYRVRTYTPFASERLDGHWRNFDLELDRDGRPARSGPSSSLRRRRRPAGADRLDRDPRGARDASARPAPTTEHSRSADRAGCSARDRTSGRATSTPTAWGHADGTTATRSPAKTAFPTTGWLRLDRPAWPTCAICGETCADARRQERAARRALSASRFSSNRAACMSSSSRNSASSVRARSPSSSGPRARTPSRSAAPASRPRRGAGAGRRCPSTAISTALRWKPGMSGRASRTS